MNNGEFKILVSDKETHARTGEIQTRSGLLQTPCFVPDATYGAVKHLSTTELDQIGLQMILGNVYHLSLRPGADIIEELGGLHQFMNWKKPIITDSGGFQALSLVYRSKLGKVRSDGVEFADHLSGTKHLLTPEKSIQSQIKMDSDILMVLDFPVNPDANDKDNQLSIELTTKWARISKKTFDQNEKSNGRILYAIVQGANDPKMRERNYNELAEMDFSGYGFGGPPINYEIVDLTARLIPDNKLRYMMGSGTPVDIVTFVSMGYDLFDCVVPTRNARHGLLYTWEGEIRITNQQYRLDQKPISENCDCYACQTYTRAYIHHLFRVNEALGQRMATVHNLTFYTQLMDEIRSSIQNQTFEILQKQIINQYTNSDKIK